MQIIELFEHDNPMNEIIITKKALLLLYYLFTLNVIIMSV